MQVQILPSALMTCTRCNTTGFLNLHQLPDWLLHHFEHTGDDLAVINFIETEEHHDVCVCDCCDGSGQHINWDKNNPPDCI